LEMSIKYSVVTSKLDQSCHGTINRMANTSTIDERGVLLLFIVKYDGGRSFEHTNNGVVVCWTFKKGGEEMKTGMDERPKVVYTSSSVRVVIWRSLNE
jgi:hypothetical protein